MTLPNNDLFKRYEDEFVFNHNLQRDIAKHVVREYGTLSFRLIKLGEETGLNKRLSDDLPFLESEVLFAIRY